MKMNVALGTIAAVALTSGAHAGISATADGPMYLGGGTDGTQNAIVSLNISGNATWDLVGDPSNTVVLYDLAAALGYASGTSITMVSVGWDTNQEALGASWLSEMRLYFDDNIAPDLSGLFLRPGVADAFPGTGSYSSGGMIDLSGAGIPNIVLPNGILRLEFHETFDDVADAIDGLFHTLSLIHVGTLEGAVPAPGALALLGLAGFAGRTRRRNA